MPIARFAVLWYNNVLLYCIHCKVYCKSLISSKQNLVLQQCVYGACRNHMSYALHTSVVLIKYFLWHSTKQGGFVVIFVLFWFWFACFELQLIILIPSWCPKLLYIIKFTKKKYIHRWLTCKINNLLFLIKICHTWAKTWVFILIKTYFDYTPCVLVF